MLPVTFRSIEDDPGGVPDDPAVVAAVWYETRTVRAAIHRARPDLPCGLAMSAGPHLLDLTGGCPCRDFLVDMLAAGDGYLRAHAGTLHNPAGAVRVFVRTRATGDWIRHRRLEKGALARTDRLRDGARGRRLPDAFHRAVLEFAADEAGSMAPLYSDEHLLRRIAVRCAAEFGPDSGDPERVRAAFDRVRRHCRTGPLVNAGTAAAPEYVSWWERYVERPLGLRPGPDEPLPPTGRWDVVCGTDGADGHALDLLAAAARGRPDDTGSALRDGLAALVHAGLLSAPAATAVLADEDRRGAAERELSTLA